jgi:G patch domain/KOW motif-containing protein
MKVGFQLNQINKRKKLYDDEIQENQKEILLSVEGNSLQISSSSSSSSSQTKELVIPLPPPRNLTIPIPLPITSSNASLPLSQDNSEVESEELIQIKKSEKTLDEIAAQELLAEISKSNNEIDNSLVINSILPKQQSNGVTAPLLLANVPPELMKITNDDERFKVDISLRAENLDVNSSAYQAIPIEQFGAAMLRGMGWSGPSPEEAKDDKKYQVVPRENRLGLGALPKPPEEKKKNRKEKDKEKSEAWYKKAESLLENQKLYVSHRLSSPNILQVDDVIWLLAPEFPGSRGIVTQTTGVPGMNKIRVSLENWGSSVEIDRREALLVTDEELKEKPFKRIFLPPEDSRRDSSRDERDYEKTSKSAKSKNSRDDHDASQTSSSRSHKRNRDERDAHSRCSETNHDQKKKQRDDHSAPSSWLRTGIRVKIVSKKAAESKYYLSKGSVADVYFPPSSSSSKEKMATIRLDSGVVLQDIKEKYLETVVPKNIGDQCMILHGEYRGQIGVIQQTDYDRDQVAVQLVEEMSEVLLLSLDSIAQLA